MCRLYGFIATDPTRLDCSLVDAQNALQIQSDRDGRGRRNADGWGIAQWVSGRPDIVRSVEPAFADRDYPIAAASVRSHAVIAHVRAATVGDVTPQNLHPFRFGPWALAHNGTLTAHEALRPGLLAEAMQPPLGTTDSELIFQWLLGRMGAHGLNPAVPAPNVDDVALWLEAGVLELVDRSIAIPGAERPLLNLVASDGRHLAASRWGNSLYYVERDGVRDCEFCGLNHCPGADAAYRAVAIASEPITDEDWREVQEGTIVAVDRYGVVTTHDLLTKVF